MVWMVQNENLHKILHKNGKRDWMYDAMEKRQLVIKSQWIKVHYNLKLKAKVILTLGNKTNRPHQPHTQIYLMGESDFWEKSLGGQMTPHHQPANVSSLGPQSVSVIHHTLRLIVNNFTIIIPLPCAFILLEWGWPKHKALGAVLLCTVCTHCNRKLPALHSPVPWRPLSPEKHICKLPCSSSMPIRQYISNTLNFCINGSTSLI